jgi:hypothetical protein
MSLPSEANSEPCSTSCVHRNSTIGCLGRHRAPRAHPRVRVLASLRRPVRCRGNSDARVEFQLASLPSLPRKGPGRRAPVGLSIGAAELRPDRGHVRRPVSRPVRGRRAPSGARWCASSPSPRSSGPITSGRRLRSSVTWRSSLSTMRLGSSPSRITFPATGPAPRPAQQDHRGRWLLAAGGGVRLGQQPPGDRFTSSAGTLAQQVVSGALGEVVVVAGHRATRAQSATRMRIIGVAGS